MMTGASSSSQSRASGLMKFILPLVPIIAGKEAGGKREVRGEPRRGLAAAEGPARPRTGNAGLLRNRDDVGRLAPLGPLDHLEADGLTLAQGAVAFLLNGRVMDKDVDAVADVDEAISLGRVKPFDLTFGHHEPPLA